MKYFQRNKVLALPPNGAVVELWARFIVIKEMLLWISSIGPTVCAGEVSNMQPNRNLGNIYG